MDAEKWKESGARPRNGWYSQAQRSQLPTIVEIADYQPLPAVISPWNSAKCRRGFDSSRTSIFTLRTRREDEWPTHDGKRLKSVIDIYQDNEELNFLISCRRHAGKSSDVRIIADPESFQLNFKWFLQEVKKGLPIVGFDIEGVTKKNYQDLCKRKPLLIGSLGAIVRHNIEHERPVLMQLSTFTGGTLLIRICRFATLPDELLLFLGDAKVLKLLQLGVGIDKDVEWLRRTWALKFKGWLDLRHLARKFKLETPKKVITFTKQGLKSFFGSSVLPCSGESAAQQRRSTLRWSFWAAEALSEAQINYAVFDAQVAADIFGTVTSLLWDVDPLEVFDERLTPTIEKALRKFVLLRFDESADALIGGSTWRRTRMSSVAEVDDETQFPYRKDILKRKELRTTISSNLDRCMPLYEVIVNDVELIFGKDLCMMLEKMPLHNADNAVVTGHRRLVECLFKPFIAMMERAQAANCNKPHQKLMWFDPINLLRRTRLKNGHGLAKLIRADDRSPMAFVHIDQVMCVLRYGRPKTNRPKESMDDPETPEQSPADECAFLEADPPLRYRLSEDAPTELARVLGKDALDERAGNLQLISKFLGVDRDDVHVSEPLPFDKSTDGRSEVGVAASVDDRLSAGTNGVRSALPPDLPVEFFQPPSPERVFDDGPLACLLRDDPDPFSFVDDDLPSPSDIPNFDDSTPPAWLHALRRLADKMRRVVSTEDVDEERFAEFALTSKECVAELCDDYQPKDIPLVYDRVTLHPCWGCGEDRVDELAWESITPDSYLRFYLCCTECVCNLARLCPRCLVLWREKQAKLMVELARVCNAPLDAPAFERAPGVDKAVSVVEKYIDVYEQMGKEMLGRKTWYLDKQLVTWLSLRVPFYSRSSGLLCAMEYELSGQVDRDNAWFLEWLRSCREALLVDHYLLPVPSSSPSVHELKVVESLGYDVVALEKVFRKGLVDLFGGRWIPPHFETIHGCWLDRHGFSACYESHAGSLASLSYLPEEDIMDEFDDPLCGATVGTVGISPVQYQNGQTSSERRRRGEEYGREANGEEVDGGWARGSATVGIMETNKSPRRHGTYQFGATPPSRSRGRGFFPASRSTDHGPIIFPEPSTLVPRGEGSCWRGEKIPSDAGGRNGTTIGRGYARCRPPPHATPTYSIVRSPPPTLTRTNGRGFGRPPRSSYGPTPVGSHIA